MDSWNEQFWRFTEQQELRLQRCSACGRFRWPPSPVCDGCLSFDSEWTAVSGRGHLVSWVVFHRGYHREYPPPHRVVLVELEEGPLFVAIPVHLPEGAALSATMPMRLAWLDGHDRFGDYYLPAFRPA